MDPKSFAAMLEVKKAEQAVAKKQEAADQRVADRAAAKHLADNPTPQSGRRYAIYKDAGGEFRFTFYGANGEPVNHEGYVNKFDCESAVNLFKASADAPVTHEERQKEASKPGPQVTDAPAPAKPAPKVKAKAKRQAAKVKGKAKRK